MRDDLNKATFRYDGQDGCVLNPDLGVDLTVDLLLG